MVETKFLLVSQIHKGQGYFGDVFWTSAVQNKQRGCCLNHIQVALVVWVQVDDMLS